MWRDIYTLRSLPISAHIMVNPIQWMKDHKAATAAVVIVLIVIIVVMMKPDSQSVSMASAATAAPAVPVAGADALPVAQAPAPPVDAPVPAGAPNAGFQGMVNPLVAVKKRLMANTRR